MWGSSYLGVMWSMERDWKCLKCTSRVISTEGCISGGDFLKERIVAVRTGERGQTRNGKHFGGGTVVLGNLDRQGALGGQHRCVAATALRLCSVISRDRECGESGLVVPFQNTDVVCVDRVVEKRSHPIENRLDQRQCVCAHPSQTCFYTPGEPPSFPGI